MVERIRTAGRVAVARCAAIERWVTAGRGCSCPVVLRNAPVARWAVFGRRWCGLERFKPLAVVQAAPC